MTIHHPKVIGLVPAYKSEKLITKTLEFLAAQDYPNLEIIICDDASPDNTFQVCQNFAKENTNFKVIRNEKNLGWLKTSELLWELAIDNCTYCFSNPHDDHPTPKYVSNLVSLLEKNPSSVLAIPGMKNIYSDNIVIDSFYTAASDEPDLAKRVIQVAKRNVHHWWSAYHGMHRTTAVKKILPIQKLPIGEPEYSVDLVWMVKMALQGGFVTSDQILLHKNYLKTSVSNQWSHNSFNRLGLWISLLNEFLKANIPLQDKKNLWKKIFSLAGEKVKLRMKTT